MEPFVSPKACPPLLELYKAGGGPSDNEWRRAESERDQQAQGSLLHFASLSAGFVRKKRLLRSDGDGRACGSATKETLITLRIVLTKCCLLAWAKVEVPTKIV